MDSILDGDDAVTEGCFVLTEEDTEIGGDPYAGGGKWTHAASTRAAACPDPRKLRAVLRFSNRSTLQSDWRAINCGPNFMTQGIDMCWFNSPLLQAVISQLPVNVRILLEPGAIADGMDQHNLENYLAFFRRFMPINVGHPEPCIAWRHYEESNLTISQLSPLTLDEINDRHYNTTRFWTSVGDFVPLDMFPNGNRMPSLVAAASTGNIEIMDMLLKAGADTSHWIQQSTPP